MILEASLYVANIMTAQITVNEDRPDLRFSKQVEVCLLKLCKELQIPIPLWLQKNSQEFARFHQTIFFKESFGEAVNFDRLRIKWITDQA